MSPEYCYQWHPDNLIEGKAYVLLYRNSKQALIKKRGVFRHFGVEYGILWAYFDIPTIYGDYQESGLDVKDIVEVHEAPK